MNDVMLGSGAFRRVVRAGWRPWVGLGRMAWCVAMACGMGLGLVAAEAKPPGLIQSEFIYETAPFPECHASTVVESGGMLVASWFGGTREKHPDVGIWVSRREGAGWSAPVEVATGAGNGGQRHPTWNPVLFQPASGPLMLFYKVGPSPSTWWGMMMVSTNHGRTWGAPRRLQDGILGPIKNKPVELPDGTLVAGSSSEHDGWRVHFEWTRDQGQTWGRTEALNDGTALGAIQPGLVYNPGDPGRLQAWVRTRQGRIFSIRDVDGTGRRWGAFGVTDLPNPNSGIDTVRGRDGRIWLIYNHTPRGRSPLNLAVSRDGSTWEAAMVLESEPGEYSYPAIIETADGMIHATWTWKRRKIRHAVIDPSGVVSRPIREGQWPE